MSLIEGIGDELTITVTIFAVFLTLVAAWISTRVSDNLLTRSQLSGLHIELNQLTQSRQPQEEGEVAHSHGSGEEVSPDELAQISSEASPEEVQNEENSLIQTQKNCEENPDNVTEGKPNVDNSAENITIGLEVDNSSETVVTSAGACGIQDVPSTEYTLLHRHRGGKQTNDADQSKDNKVKPEKVSENKSENRTPPKGDISLKIKFLNETERVVRTTIEETVGNFKRLNFSEESRDGRVVHLIFNGQFLRDDNRQLGSYSIVNNCVLHCHISQHQQSPGSTSQQTEQGELDLGQFMVPLFACTIGFVWYLRWQYSYMFNTMSTMSLSAVTVLFMLAVLAAWRG